MVFFIHGLQKIETVAVDIRWLANCPCYFFSYLQWMTPGQAPRYRLVIRRFADPF